jgi:hypothetical protein
MQLSVQVNTSAQVTTFKCRGKIVQGNESDYLFDLLTRPENRDVVLDLQQVSEFDYNGLLILVICQEYFSSQRRELSLRLPPSAPEANAPLNQPFPRRRHFRHFIPNLSSHVMQALRAAATAFSN